MKKYTLEDVQEAALALQTFLAVNTDVSIETNPLIEELKTVKLVVENLDDAVATVQKFREIVNRDRATIIANLKKLGNNRWPGMYVLHDLICAMAHLGFVTRYAIKDTKEIEENDS